VTRNLVDNAVKYSPPAAPVEVRVEPVGDEVRVLVRDHGPGFTPQEAERLFELYYRAPSTAGAASGSGIGLFVCQRLVEAMHGRIWAARAPGGGAEFGFALRTVTEDA
jgi:signal transduction histidine kinase